MKIIAILLLIVSCFSPFSTAAQGELNPNLTANLQALVDSAVAAGDTGVVLWVAMPEGTFASAGGYANVEAEIPLLPGASFRVASITKLFTATVILQLMEEGVLTLDDPLSKWLPASAAQIPYGAEITLYQLLTHTSGVYDYIIPVVASFHRNPGDFQRHWSGDEIVRLVSSANFAPGNAFSYSNTGYILLGMVIEAATGKALAVNFRQRIFEPLGMNATYLGYMDEPMSQLVEGYTEGGRLYADYDGSILGGAGGIVANAPDLLKFVQALFGGELFTQETTLPLMLTTTALSGSTYALGIKRISTRLGDAYGHNGVIFGYTAEVYHIPDAGITVILLSNQDRPHISLAGVLGVLAEALP